jgi:kynurenine formamidase
LNIFIGFDPAAVQWLVDNRNVNGIGTDGPSIESPKTTEHKAHRAMAAKNGYNLEMLGSVEQLTQSGSFMIIGPMKIRGGSGSPARVYGLVPPFTAEESALIKKTAKSVIADWSYDLAPDTLRWPTGSAFRSQPENLNKNLGYWFYMNNVCMPEHIGTHLDAPVHFSKDGLSVADIEIQHFISSKLIK